MFMQEIDDMRCKDKLKIMEILNLIHRLLAESLKIKTKDTIKDDLTGIKKAFQDLENLNKSKSDFLKRKSFQMSVWK